MADPFDQQRWKVDGSTRLTIVTEDSGEPVGFMVTPHLARRTVEDHNVQLEISRARANLLARRRRWR